MGEEVEGVRVLAWCRPRVRTRSDIETYQLNREAVQEKQLSNGTVAIGWLGEEEMERRERKWDYKGLGDALKPDLGHRHRGVVEEGSFCGLWKEDGPSRVVAALYVVG